MAVFVAGVLAQADPNNGRLVTQKIANDDDDEGRSFQALPKGRESGARILDAMRTRQERNGEVWAEENAGH